MPLPARLQTPPSGMLDTGLRHRPFPDDTASLLPGLLIVTRTGLTPASDDELANQPSTTYMINHQPFWRHRQVVGQGVVLPGLVVVAIAARYTGYRYPIEIIGHAVWLYHRFALSLRDVEEQMLARGVVLTTRRSALVCQFGPDYANQLRRRRPRPGDKWHLDEVFVKINGTTNHLWRAVDQHGDMLDILVQSRTKRQSSQAVLPKAAQGPAICAAGDRHRQAGQLSVRSPRAGAVGDPSTLQVPQQPG